MQWAPWHYCFVASSIRKKTNPALANCSAAHIYNLLKGKINEHSAGLCDVERLEFVEEKKADDAAVAVVVEEV